MDKRCHDPLFHRLIYLRIKAFSALLGKRLMGQRQDIHILLHRKMNGLDHRVNPLLFAVRHIGPQRIDLDVRRYFLQRLRHPETVLTGVIKIVVMITVSRKIFSSRVKSCMFLKSKSPVHDPDFYSGSCAQLLRRFYMVNRIVSIS